MPAKDAQLNGEAFWDASDLTVGIEEELQVVDPQTMALSSGFSTLADQLAPDMKDFVHGEMISSEVEVTTRACGSATEAAADLLQQHRRLVETARAARLALCGAGVHPFSPWHEQRIIDTPHYRLVEEELGYVAWRNNTFSFHVHVGVHDPERALQVVNALRGFLPPLLALSASSPFYEGRPTRLHSTRSQLFTCSFPRCGLPDTFPDWPAYRRYLDFLYRGGCISEAKQVWWSVRPHLAFGTVEVRICDGQPDPADAGAIACFITALVARVLEHLDAGLSFTHHPRPYLGENLWRAIRHGLSGNLLDLANCRVVPATEVVAGLLDWTHDLWPALDMEWARVRLADLLQHGNSAQRQLALHQEGVSLRDIQGQLVEQTMLERRESMPLPPASGRRLEECPTATT